MTPLDFGGPVDVPFEPWTYAELDEGVPARFWRIAQRIPDALAVQDAETSWTYAQLASAVACVQEALAGAVSPVAIESDHSRFTAAAILGALAAGRPYVPLDPAFPAERNRHIREHSGAERVLTRASLEDLCARAATLAEPRRPSGDAVAYILYTSGSTGTPKGVYQSQRNLLHDVMQYVHSVHLSAADRLTMLYSASTIGAVRDLFGALLTGASVHLHAVGRAGFARLRERLRDERITIYHSVPPVFRAFLAEGDLFDAVRIVYLAGDRLDAGDVALFRRHFVRGAKLYTGIGCTEASTLYRQWFIDHDTLLGETSVPVGRTIADRPSRLLDGEIEVSSRYLALGYWREPELTRERFLPTPGDPESRTFRPGDRGVERPDGLLEFLGRGDQQVKIRGHRVELAEVERALASNPDARDVAVACRDGTLTAFYAGTHDIAWRDFLAPLLPAHMIPARFDRLNELPRLGNFKLDRRALGERSEISAVFSELLRRECDLDTDFWEAGGDSLLALRLPLELEKRLGRALPADLLAHGATPRAIARLLDAPDARPVMLFAPSIEGSSGAAQVLAPSLAGFRVLGLSYPESGGGIAGLAAELRLRLAGQDVRPPYRLVGYSFGGRVAFEMARQWAEQGEPTELLCVIDTPPCGPLELARTGRVVRAARFARRLLHTPTALWPDVIAYTRHRKAAAPDPARRAAFLSYGPQPYPGRLLLLRAAGENLGWERLPEDLGWSQYCRGGVRVRYFDGTHDIFNPWSSASLNRALRGGHDAE